MVPRDLRALLQPKSLLNFPVFGDSTSGGFLQEVLGAEIVAEKCLERLLLSLEPACVYFVASLS